MSIFIVLTEEWFSAPNAALNCRRKKMGRRSTRICWESGFYLFYFLPHEFYWIFEIQTDFHFTNQQFNFDYRKSSQNHSYRNVQRWPNRLESVLIAVNSCCYMVHSFDVLHYRGSVRNFRVFIEFKKFLKVHEFHWILSARVPNSQCLATRIFSGFRVMKKRSCRFCHINNTKCSKLCGRIQDKS